MHRRLQLFITLFLTLPLAFFSYGDLWSVGSPAQWQGQVPAADLALAPAPQLPPGQPTASPEVRWRSWQGLAPDLQAKVDPRILAELRGEVLPAHLGGVAMPGAALPRMPMQLARTRFLVYLQDVDILAALREQLFASQTAQRTAVFATLMATTQAQQAALRSTLDRQLQAQQIAGYQPFYIVNAIAVEGSLETVVELAQRADVVRLVANYPLFKADEPIATPVDTAEAPVQGAAATALDPENWNIALVRADQVWTNLGVTGAGAVVAGFDTGVTFRHPALVRQYRGYLGNNQFNHNYNWFEPDGLLYSEGNLGPSVSSEPRDCDSHGTHTMGTAVGSGAERGNAVGMAPGAKWIAVPGICYNTMSGGIRDDIGGLKAFQWLLCPTDLTGDLATADCSKAPDVVNNSWGSANPVNEVLRPAIQALRAANIAPVFAAGNPGAGPGSIGTPGNAPEAITVGATDGNDLVAPFSGRGPSFYAGEQKPELSAPGVGVKSTVGNSAYTTASGTSMAAPHVTGLIALMVAADLRDGVRDFSVDELERFMTYTAVDLGAPGPDDDYGFGRIDAFAAVSWVLQAGDLRGTVRDATTRTPVQGAVVRGVGARDFATTTGATGVYSVTVPAGSYTVVVDAWGYTRRTFASQTVLASALSLADFALTPVAKATVQGAVRSGSAPVADAMVYVQAQPAVRTTTGRDGRYTLALPFGEHQLVVEQPGFRRLTQAVTVVAGGVSQDLALEAAPSILLVEADAYRGWFSGWSISNIFRRALDQERYAYTLWRVESTSFNDTEVQVDGSLRHGIPSPATLANYDVVIWVQIGCDSGYWGCFLTGSPTSMGANDELMAYLDGGGRLILSGQDLGFWEAGQPFFEDYLNASFVNDSAAAQGDRLVGAGFLSNMALTVTNASLYGYRNGSIELSPDAVTGGTGAATAYPLLLYEASNLPAALAVDSCASDYRVVYYSVGFENIGPRGNQRNPAIAEALGRSLRWVNNRRPAVSIELNAAAGTGFNLPGQVINHAVQLVNTGQQTATISLAALDALWPTQILSGTAVVAGNLQLPPCQTLELTVAVQVPANAANGERDDLTLRATVAQNQPQTAALTLTSTAFAQWQSERMMPTTRYGLGGAALPNSTAIYAIGGWYNDTSNLDPFVQEVAAAANERYDACTGEWATMAPLPGNRANLGVGVLAGKIYAVGGTNMVISFGSPTVTYHATVFVYDPVANQWQEVAPLPAAYAAMAVVGVGDKLYAFGGIDSRGDGSNRTYIYDPARNQWQEGAPIPGASRYLARAALFAGKIYLVGGYPDLASVLLYDPATNRWQTGPALQNGRYAFGLAAGPDDYLYVVGGAADATEVRSMERLRASASKWEFAPSPRERRREGAVAVYTAGRLYTIGGAGATSTLEAMALGPSFCRSAHTTTVPVVGLGKPLTYTVELYAPRNDLAAAQFVLTLPAQTTFAGFVANPVGATYDQMTRQVRWRGRLAGGSGPQRISYRVATAGAALADGDRLTSTAYFDNGSGTTFTRTVTSVLLKLDLQESTKAASLDRALSSDIFTYTIHLQGRGYVGTPVTLRDPLPAGINYVPGTLKYNTGNGRYDAATRSILWNGSTVQQGATYLNLADHYVWGDSDGGGEIDDVAHTWLDIAQTGTPVTAGDIIYTCGLPVGFVFPFYAERMQEFCVSTNGFISFDREGGAEDSNVCPLPSQSSNRAIIAAIWDDLVVDGQIYYQTFGNAPNRYLVVQWQDVRRYGASTDAYANFQAVLFENGVIRLAIKEAGALRGLSSTTGIESPDERQGSTYACNEAGTLHDQQTILFVPPGVTLGAAMATLQFQATGATTVGANAVVTNTAIITTAGTVLARQAAILLNPVRLEQSTLAVDQPTVAPGEQVRYQLLLQNQGLMTATNAALTIALPTALRYVAGTLACSVGICPSDRSAPSWRGAIAPGQPTTVTFGAELSTGLPDRTPLVTTAVLADGHGATYTMTATILARRSDLSRSQLALRPPYGEPGSIVELTMLIHNLGGLATQGEATVMLPEGLLYQPDSLLCGVGVCTDGAGKIQWQGELAARAIVPIRLAVQIPPTAAYGERFTITASLRDVDWAEEFTFSSALRVAHLLYLPVVNGPELGNPLFLPLVGQ